MSGGTGFLASWKRKGARFLASPGGLGITLLVVFFFGVPLVTNLADLGMRSYAHLTRGREKRILARVNDEPIYERELAASAPYGMFEMTAKEIQDAQIQRLIQQTEIKQFLRQHQITVADKQVDAAVQDMRRNPPSLGCACCRYASLNAYLDATNLTMAELEGDLYTKIGLQQYVQDLWKQTYSTQESRKALLTGSGAWMAKDYVHGWQIFFNTFQRVDQHASPAEVDARAKAHAQAAWARLQKGEAFAAVAADVSEDQMTKPKGGDLGTIRRTAYGKEFAAMLQKLPAGQLSHPFKSAYGWHIIKWAPMNGQEELLNLGQRNFVEAKTGEILGEIHRTARVVRM